VQAKRSAGSANNNNEAAEDSDSSDIETERVEQGEGNAEHEVDADAPAASPNRETFPVKVEKQRNSIAEDVIGRKGRYGRFASHWFSKKGWSAEKRSSQGMSSTDPSEVSLVTPATLAAPVVVDDKQSEPMSPTPQSEALTTEKATDAANTPKDQTSKLLPKLLRHSKMLFGGRHFYMSYDYDITRRFGVEDLGKSYLPLHRVVDPLVGIMPPLLF
jgi:hypothetical protein